MLVRIQKQGLDDVSPKILIVCDSESLGPSSKYDK